MTALFHHLYTWSIFQLTSSRRGWLKRRRFSQEKMIFQLTSSRRGWLRSSASWFFPEYFNSHPHEEDDLYLRGWIHGSIIFQLTSSRRGWRQLWTNNPWFKIAKFINIRQKYCFHSQFNLISIDFCLNYRLFDGANDPGKFCVLYFRTTESMYP